MSFVIPDEVLENLICHSCYRFLSAPPVKVYTNRHVRCGRCIQNNDKAVISSYHLVAEKSLFKCVNRFDGCRTLLRSSQVVEHETECDTRKYACPCCENIEIPSFLIPKHFEEHHQSLILRSPSFSIDLRKSFIEYDTLFFYRFKDNLFMILFRFNPDDEVILLNTFHFGEKTRAIQIKQRFSVHFTGSEITFETDERHCIPYSKEVLKNSGKSGGFFINFSKMSARQYIDVELKLNVADVVGILTISSSDQIGAKPVETISKRLFRPRRGRGSFLNNSLRKPNPETLSNILGSTKSTNTETLSNVLVSTKSTNTDIIITLSKSTNTLDISDFNLRKTNDSEYFRRLSALCFKKNLTLPRKVYLDAYFKKHYPDFSSDLDFYKLINSSPARKVDIVLPCHICCELNYDVNSYRKSFFFRQEQSYLWMCSPCYHLYQKTEENRSKFSHAWLVLDYDIYSYVKFFCSWGCTTTLTYTEIFKHESNCANQPSQKCPVDRCSFQGKLFEIEKHFSTNHPSPEFVNLKSTFITKLNRNERYEFQWYVWTPPFFVLVKFSWRKVYRWLVTVSMCDGNSKVQPKLFLFDKDWKFLITVKAGPKEQSIDEREDVRIKCCIECIS